MRTSRLSADIEPTKLRDLKVKLLNQTPPKTVKSFITETIDDFLSAKPNSRKKSN